MEEAGLYSNSSTRLSNPSMLQIRIGKICPSFRNKELPGLLTTTILERGITIPNVQVAVVGAEQQIFDKGAIQIGGRVGRSAEYPTGDFILFHNGITYAMDEAKTEIHKLNKGGIPHMNCLLCEQKLASTPSWQSLLPSKRHH